MRSTEQRKHHEADNSGQNWSITSTITRTKSESVQSQVRSSTTTWGRTRTSFVSVLRDWCGLVTHCRASASHWRLRRMLQCVSTKTWIYIAHPV